MKICLVTGGTGGHIYPAVSLASALKKTIPDIDLLFIGNADRMEATEIPALGYAFKGLPARGMSGNLWRRIKALFSLWKSQSLAYGILEEYHPDIVIGFGGYVCVPVIRAARKLGIKTLLHEQNAIAGKANLFLARIVDGIAVSYPENLNQFPQAKTRLIGNPRTYALKERKAETQPLEALNLDPLKPTVLFVMGSLGAESINDTVATLLDRLDRKGIQVIYVTGRKHYGSFIELHDETRHIRIVPYVDQLELMGKVDLMVTRGGATTAAEIMVTGCPSIIIPSPYVPNNHQYYNAKALEEAGGCVLIEEKDLDIQRLASVLENLLEDPKARETMRTKALKLGHPNAAEDLIGWIREIVGT